MGVWVGGGSLPALYGHYEDQHMDWEWGDPGSSPGTTVKLPERPLGQLAAALSGAYLAG